MGFPYFEGLLVITSRIVFCFWKRRCFSAAWQAVGTRRLAEGLLGTVWLTTEWWDTTCCWEWHPSHWAQKMLWGPQSCSAPTEKSFQTLLPGVRMEHKPLLGCQGSGITPHDLPRVLWPVRDNLTFLHFGFFTWEMWQLIPDVSEMSSDMEVLWLWLHCLMQRESKPWGLKYLVSGTGSVCDRTETRGPSPSPPLTPISNPLLLNPTPQQTQECFCQLLWQREEFGDAELNYSSFLYIKLCHCCGLVTMHWLPWSAPFGVPVILLLGGERGTPPSLPFPNLQMPKFRYPHLCDQHW